MKIFKEEIIDILLISSDRLIYYDLEEKDNEIKLKRLEILKGEIYSNGVFFKENFEKALKELLTKYKLNELGVILHLPNIFFQRITIPRTTDPASAIKNYLQVNLPLPLERYKFIFKEDIYKLSGNLANFDIFFFPREIEEAILEVIFKENLTIYFIAPSVEAILSNLIYEAKITFSENYLVFFIDEKLTHILYLENLKLESLFLEEISENTNFEIFFQRYIGYFQSLNKKFEILIFSFKETALSNLQTILINPYEFIAKGGVVLLRKIFQDQPFLDFLNLKPKNVYFFTKIRRPILVASIFLIVVSLIAILVFGFYYSKLSQTEKEIKENLAKHPLRGNLKEIQNSLDYLLEIVQKIENKKNENYLKVLFLSEKYSLESYDFDRREAIFKVPKEKLEDFRKELLNLNYRQEEDKDYYRVIVNY